MTKKETKWTPGPWQCVLDWQYDEIDGRTNEFLIADSDDNCLASSECAINRIPSSANFELIALAPEMAEELQFWEWSGEDCHGRQYCDRCGALKRDGHNSGCKIASILERLPK